MTILVDAFGGDNAPLAVLQGAAQAVDAFGIEAVLVGDEEKIKACAHENQISLQSICIKHAPDIMLMEDAPTEIMKSKQNSSMAAGLRALADGEGDAFVSAGSTGALVVGGTFTVKRVHGVRRVAIASMMPSNEAPFLLIDCGANVECRADMLHQFAVMGDIYMHHVAGVHSPRVGLANIGTEKTKGGALQLETYRLLQESGLNFIGNVEARQIPFGGCDVIVADGFTGNMILKLYEGVASAMMQNIKAIYKKSLVTKLSALLVKNGLTAFKQKMDYTEFGGAPLLGLKKPVIKAHGSSNARAFQSAIRQARDAAKSGMVDVIAQNLPRHSPEES